jgi:RNA polymerase sigma-70 factor (ECF subfamily)
VFFPLPHKRKACQKRDTVWSAIKVLKVWSSGRRVEIECPVTNWNGGTALDTQAGEVTQLLLELRKGDKTAEAKLISLVYSELRRLARHCMQGERSGHSLQATALVHEAYLRLTGMQNLHWQNRAQFFAISARVMRRILVDSARARGARKRGGSQNALSFDEALVVSPSRPERFLALDEALNKLAEFDARQSQIVEMRFFGGLGEDEIGSLLGISARTVKREWRMAKAWLYEQLGTP